jgi:outer membrane protein TolC
MGSGEMWFGWVIVAALQSPGQAGAPPGALTLDAALRQARLGRGRPSAAAAGVAEARGQLREAGEIPHASLSFERTGDTPHKHLTVDESFSWLLTRGPDRAAARAGVRRAQADSAGTMAELVQDVRIAFYDALAAVETLRLVGDQVGFSDSLVRIAQARLNAGDISRFEYEQAAQDARRTQQLLSETRETARTAAAALGRAVGWDGAAPPVPTGPLDAELDTDTTLTFSVDSIPAVRSARADSVATQYSLLSARRGRILFPSLTGGAEWDDPSEPGKTLSVIGFSIPFPPIDRAKGEIGIAQARADLATSELREARLEGSRAVAEARIRLAETARRARFARDSLIPAARDLRLRAVTAYRAGETGILPVLDALRSERDVVQTAVQDLQTFQEALARWLALFGRTE